MAYVTNRLTTVLRCFKYHRGKMPFLFCLDEYLATPVLIGECHFLLRTEPEHLPDLEEIDISIVIQFTKVHLDPF